MSSGRGSERVLLLLEWLAGKTRAVTLAEATDALAAPKSSVLNLLRMLVEMGYVEKEGDSGYRLIRLPGEVGAGHSMHGTLLRRCDGAVRTAVERSKESGFIAVREGDYIRYLCKILPDREIRYDRNIEVQRRTVQVSSGIAILTGLDDAALAEVLNDAEADGLDEAEVLRARVNKARMDGYAVTHRGVVEGAAGVAAPISDASGVVVAALNIAGPAARLNDNLDNIIEIVRDGAIQASEALGWRNPNHDA
ncbi:IclR family transcriptional regulator [Tranquillimonas alkanivorans]|uniref:Transcriptional regulator, IclR family n=1 Tax=Tranquillimonas alkanivorans TaxID=441119 RepID=A0A1I5TMA8_9RHOB|nr:helix-turn-helix domain-containing protein [Tranquillimonas alkanivorans]SFP83757.1 transcriptional regulator, IclR family [Tranquillimonas alkanivorans]